MISRKGNTTMSSSSSFFPVKENKIQSISRPLNEHNVNNTDGVWRLLHIIAEDATDLDGMLMYERVFKNLCQKFNGCDCENHCIKMLEDNPIENWFYDMNNYPNLKLDKNGIPVGCLDHSFYCHNLVNRRLNRKEYTFEELRPLYRKPMEPCTKETDLNNNNNNSESRSSILNKNNNDNDQLYINSSDTAEKIFSIYDLASKYPNLFKNEENNTMSEKNYSQERNYNQNKKSSISIKKHKKSYGSNYK
jgi:hypothetical protein